MIGVLADNWGVLVQGLWTTLAITALAYVSAVVLGTLVAVFRVCPVPPLRAVGAVDGVRRIRFTSPHPNDFTDRVLAAMAEVPQLCEHVHLPMQSGSTRVLKRMLRRYTREGYRECVARLRAAVPEAGRDGGRGGRDVGEDRAGEQGEFGEALAGLGRMHELAGGPEHLLGGER